MEYIYKQNNFSVMVSFDSTAYTVTEGVDPTVELMLIRGGDLNRVVVVTVTTVPATANGMIRICHVNNEFCTRIVTVSLFPHLHYAIMLIQ